MKTTDGALLMKEVAIFDIPVYSGNEETFNKKWAKKKQKEIACFIDHGHSSESAAENVNRICGNESIWKFNQIIGYITVLISRQDIRLEVSLMPAGSRFRFETRPKKYIRAVEYNGLHFRIVGMDNDGIKKALLEEIQSLQKRLSEPRYIDIKTLLNVIDHIDFVGIASAI